MKSKNVLTNFKCWSYKNDCVGVTSALTSEYCSDDNHYRDMGPHSKGWLGVSSRSPWLWRIDLECGFSNLGLTQNDVRCGVSLSRMSLSLLITGGSGYLGQFLIEGLKDQYRASENSEIESLDMRQGSIEIPKANSPFK